MGVYFCVMVLTRHLAAAADQHYLGLLLVVDEVLLIMMHKHEIEDICCCK